MSGQPEEALDVLRALWSAQGQTAADVDEASGTTKSCKRMADVGFEGLAAAGGDVRAAWRDTLRREGKLATGTGSVRDLVLGQPPARAGAGAVTPADARRQAAPGAASGTDAR